MRKVRLAHLASKGAPMTGRPDTHDTLPPDPDSAKTQTGMEPINPDLAPTAAGMQPIDPDDAPTMIDTRYRHHHLLARGEDDPNHRHLLARGVDDPYIDQDQLDAISYESSMATFSPARHESAYFDDQPSMSMSLSAIQAAALTAEGEVAAEDDQ